MKIKEIFTHPRFDKNYKKLPETIKEKAKKEEVLFLDIGTHDIYK